MLCYIDCWFCFSGTLVYTTAVFEMCIWNATRWRSKVTEERWLGWDQEALCEVQKCAVLGSSFTFVISFAGKFREKASILHKIAKKKCQVEDSEKANGVASRSGDDFKLTLMLCGRIVYSFLIELTRLIKSRVYKAKSKYKLISFMEFQCSCPGVCNLWFLSHLLLAMIISVSFF